MDCPTQYPTIMFSNVRGFSGAVSTTCAAMINSNASVVRRHIHEWHFERRWSTKVSMHPRALVATRIDDESVDITSTTDLHCTLTCVVNNYKYLRSANRQCHGVPLRWTAR